jgi:hypothetical protein
MTLLYKLFCRVSSRIRSHIRKCCVSGTQGKLFDEKKERSKISCHLPSCFFSANGHKSMPPECCRGSLQKYIAGFVTVREVEGESRTGFYNNVCPTVRTLKLRRAIFNGRKVEAISIGIIFHSMGLFRPSFRGNVPLTSFVTLPEQHNSGVAGAIFLSFLFVKYYQTYLVTCLEHNIL